MCGTYLPCKVNYNIRTKKQPLMKSKLLIVTLFMIGDAERDVKAGKKAGVKTIHITGGKETTDLADWQFGSLFEASQFITKTI